VKSVAVWHVQEEEQDGLPCAGIGKHCRCRSRAIAVEALAPSIRSTAELPLYGL
jgi:hypothetical protein